MSPKTDELHRLHPLTPLLKGWKWLAGLGVIGAQQTYGDLNPRTYLVVLAALLPVAAAYGFVSWRFTRYRVDGEDLRLETGVLFRSSRRVRLDRLQAVDVVRPLLARALGLAELRLEVVGGGSAEAALAYLAEPEAHRLRAELLARAAGLHEQTPEAPERVLATVPPVRLALSGLLSVPVVLGLLAVAGIAGTGLALGQPASLGVLVPGLLAVAGPLYTTFVRSFGFTVAESPDGLRLRAGLLETRAQTVPPGRVQAVRLVRPWAWRLCTDWARLEVNVAGYAGEGQAQASVLLPVGPVGEVAAVLARALPGVDVSAVPLAPAPRRSRLVDPVAWRRLAVGADERVFVSQRGVLRHELDVVPHDKIQSVRWAQGPLQRRLGLATVFLDSTPGPVRPRAAHRDAAEAAALVQAQVERARAARAGSTPDRWMTGAG